MKKYKSIIIAANLILVLVLFNFSVVKKEMAISDGDLIFLELAPVDPRSLMQGDYMSLNYAICDERSSDDDYLEKGYFILSLDSYRVAKTVRVQETLEPLSAGEYALCFSQGANYRTTIGAESYFFQEGQGEKYEAAKFGGVKLDKGGSCILIGLYDENFKKIE
jgi:uncharacterized membrane-anchored protein